MSANQFLTKLYVTALMHMKMLTWISIARVPLFLRVLEIVVNKLGCVCARVHAMFPLVDIVLHVHSNCILSIFVSWILSLVLVMCPGSSYQEFHSMVSVTCGKPPSKNAKWKIPEIIRKFQIAYHPGLIQWNPIQFYLIRPRKHARACPWVIF